MVLRHACPVLAAVMVREMLELYKWQVCTCARLVLVFACWLRACQRSSVRVGVREDGQRESCR